MALRKPVCFENQPIRMKNIYQKLHFLCCSVDTSSKKQIFFLIISFRFFVFSSCSYKCDDEVHLNNYQNNSLEQLRKSIFASENESLGTDLKDNNEDSIKAVSTNDTRILRSKTQKRYYLHYYCLMVSHVRLSFVEQRSELRDNIH